MSFQSKGFWMPKDAACLPDGEMAYDNSSRIEPKRPHQWFVDGTEAELFPNKKQAVDIPSNNSFSGIPNGSLSSWMNVPGFHSAPSHFTERLLDPETTRSINFDERSFPSISQGNMNMGRKSIDDPLFNDASFGLSISHSLEDSRASLNYGGIRKVKVSQVKDSENMLSVPLGTSGARADNEMPMTDNYNKVNDVCGVSMPITYSRGDESAISTGDSFSGEAETFIAMNQPCSRGDSSISMGHNYKDDNDTMLLANSFSKVDNSLLSASQSFSKGDNNIISISQAFSKGDNNMISMSQSYNNMSERGISMSNSYNRGGDTPLSICPSNNKVDSGSLSMSHAFEKGEGNIISFGSFNDDDDVNGAGRLLCNYELLMAQSSVHGSNPLRQKDLVASDAGVLASSSIITVPGADSGSRRKDDQKSTKKTPANNFPSNVRSLLSTGILDGVPVKYIAWSRESMFEQNGLPDTSGLLICSHATDNCIFSSKCHRGKELPAIIRGSGYLCGCQSCNMSKVINAYEFERHAGCKTKHPNNHIYFENGKTIYGIVQELRSTPQNMLFDVIQTITGSPINQKSFRAWKESFLAATRELQRIYGKD